MSSASDFIIENGVLKKYVGPGGDVVIPGGVTSIGEGAFCECRSLTSVVIPDGVTSIGDGAFYECSKLKSLEIYSSIKLAKDIFNRVKPERVTTVDPGNLPVAWRPIAAVGYAENPAEPGSEREKKHLKFI